MRFLLAVLLLLALPARAEFNPPGLAADASAYQSRLAAPYPAGGTPQARRQAEQRAADAQRRNDWAGVAQALEARIGAGNETNAHWLDLARAQLRRTPPEAARAAAAAWRAFSGAEPGPGEIPALLVLAEAFRAGDRPEQAIAALEAVGERAPGDAGYARQLADARRAAGMLVRKVSPEPEADPPRACIAFTTAPARRADFVPGDWVHAAPPTPGLSVTREGDQVCLSGLRLGATTTVTLRAGLPGEDGLRLNKDAVLPVAMGNREARLILDNRMFLLPRKEAPRITLASVNLSAVKLKLLRTIPRPATSAATPSTASPGTASWCGRAAPPSRIGGPTR